MKLYILYDSPIRRNVDMNKFNALIILYPSKLYVFEYSFKIKLEKGLFSAIIWNKFSILT